MTTQVSRDNFVSLGQAVVKIELRAIEQLIDKINQDFAKACELLLGCQGRIIVIGMGKSGHIANKIAATFSSTGSPAFFLHAGEASHGDLGMITNKDVVVALSNSGETDEVTRLLPLIKRLNVRLISLTGNPTSSLATFADVNLDISVEKEACPMNLSPTASTTVSLVMGDALAVVLLEAKGFSEQDFALSHPGGSLGKRLLLKVDDVMHSGKNIPMVLENTSISDALLEMTNKRLGMTCVVDSQGNLKGVFTDGDLRRTLAENIDLNKVQITSVMTRNTKTVSVGKLAAEAVQMMEENAINAIVVTNKFNQPVGALNMYDLLKAGIV